MIVIETPLLAGLYLPMEHTPLSEEIYRKDPVWLAPLLWRSEMLSLVTLYFGRDHIDLAKSTEIMSIAEEQMKNKEYRPVASDVLEKAKESNLSSRDCEFVSIATFVGVPLLTLNQGLLKAFPDVAVHPEAFRG